MTAELRKTENHLKSKGESGISKKLQMGRTHIGVSENSNVLENKFFIHMMSFSFHVQVSFVKLLLFCGKFPFNVLGF